MLRIDKKLTVLFTSTFLLCASLACATDTVVTLTPSEPESFRPAAMLIGGLKSAISALQEEIDKIESGAVGVPTLKEDLDEANAKLAAVKKQLGISTLETQKESINQQMDRYAQGTFKAAQADDTFLYYTLNEKITDLFEDPRIKRRINQIIKLKQEIAEIMGSALQEIKSLGDQINTLTQNEQRSLSSLRIQLAQIQNQLETTMNSEAARSRIAALRQETANIKHKIDNLLALRFTEDRINLMEQYKNRMRQYQLMLDYLRNPLAIPITTEEELIAID